MHRMIQRRCHERQRLASAQNNGTNRQDELIDQVGVVELPIDFGAAKEEDAAYTGARERISKDQWRRRIEGSRPRHGARRHRDLPQYDAWAHDVAVH